MTELLFMKFKFGLLGMLVSGGGIQLAASSALDGVYKELAQGGAAGLFIGFLIYCVITLWKANQSLQNEHKKSLTAIIEDNKNTIDRILKDRDQ